MTIFLAFSALTNIALGYGLAIYLGGAPLPFHFGKRKSAAPVSEPLVETHDAHAPAGAEMGMPAFAAAPPAQAGLPIEMAAVAPSPAAVATPAATPASFESAAAPAEPAELENEVLAGIEEFRNQLAQMKAQPAGAESPVAQPALAASAN